MDLQAFIPYIVFLVVAGGLWVILNLFTQKENVAEERLDRIGRPKSLADLEEMAKEDEQKKFQNIRDMVSTLGKGMEPKNDAERNTLKTKLANAGFHRDIHMTVFFGLVMAFRLMSLLPPVLFYLLDPSQEPQIYLFVAVASVAGGWVIPSFVFDFMIAARQQAIFLTLPDALDLMVVCVESGLGLDAAMRKVNDEMAGHAPVLCEEFALANLQLQMGVPRREVLHELGVRTGVDDMRSLAAILIQADRFGSSIAQALRVQSDSMRTRRRQIAEEKAAKTAVQLIFPLVLFIFPAIFVVLVGPAAIQISKVSL
ncbi:type II secretion system F family protein [Tuwongella immobilis]|uniref:Type II secretion system protein GspF domain-containing protein n=1 Tax=Tuwongella immobilis TaxID=692036 RepID=A0A6C2YVI3_9BACT|nr:type II secretion system F family protein [Tuwongella immobilis]VIP05401.1 Flp pilus assembly protein TadC OS=Singulisphaera acidiphila (strain ATCC BAA-1392 / DSM 18658 / VKM B-2454 / MOB10) GN=Sinac_1940 PE=4 SV=1: T2SF [Tuwongella immobilis]VTS08158.1 Flp pilus assembly protein TadC OS=Singulisphaera acidiphila (strain ATCC BAA-1392 / DSM 18658 / VKM B-2454 / MOB10) GN=Sinac_1940 PE=4 SV=1: T2SF [Tuwongella immobilis]